MVDPLEGPKEACKTYVEQTKLLVTLASAFVVAPAALIPLLKGEEISFSEALVKSFFKAEICFVGSVLFGYIVLATIAGYQHKNRYNVHRLATRLASLAQIATYLLGLWLFVDFVRAILNQVSSEEKPASRTIFSPREVLFEKDRSTIDADTLRDLAILARDLATTSDSIYLEGYADPAGSSDYNLSLSRSRAEAVRSVFVQEGVRNERIKIMPYGETRPIGRDDTVEGRSRNRRVVIRVEDLDTESPNTPPAADG